ncbi:hypothetical protein HELRODRAFT_97407 [Helobdella robusta]|uniref:High affinity cGMP-specific 3',5'-cyclic phosphodiesterase 9A n=1 Tax=Helobdella robusta TaxID=6412 RepID=T1G9G6_HELRO|nr:hypothetical protein HELRODRAFT_97407 [Helobdella robusta]ESO10190.1 hypothetical protein HELRODRAFT_97407 [Helobdella robusta]
MVFMQHIISDFNINKIYNIEQETMQRWMRRIFLSYNDAPFHNFKHSFCVTQMIYAMLKTLDLSAKLAPLDIFILLFSGACHDLDHTGFNNTFHINAQTELALRYNDASPLENHHSATAFHILQDEDCNILKNMEPSDYLTFRRGVIRCILATDLAKHDAILDEFIAVLPLFDFKNNNHKLLLSMILIKIADISNEARPVECANIWMECLFQEYFHQSDVEKFKGLQVTPYMDRETVSKCKSQIAFIKTLLLPLIKSLHTLCPGSKEITRAVQRNMNHYMLRDK